MRKQRSDYRERYLRQTQQRARMCQALRSNDEMHCGHCGLQWAIDDPDRPVCPVKAARDGE